MPGSAMEGAARDGFEYNPVAPGGVNDFSGSRWVVTIAALRRVTRMSRRGRVMGLRHFLLAAAVAVPGCGQAVSPLLRDVQQVNADGSRGKLAEGDLSPFQR